MSEQKFFSGLTDKMMNKHNRGQERQQTNFFWPDETDTKKQTVPSSNQLRNSTNSDESRKRSSQQKQSNIEFYDDVSDSSRSKHPTHQQNQELHNSKVQPDDYVEIKVQKPDINTQSFTDQSEESNSEPSVIVHKITMTS